MYYLKAVLQLIKDNVLQQKMNLHFICQLHDVNCRQPAGQSQHSITTHTSSNATYFLAAALIRVQELYGGGAYELLWHSPTRALVLHIIVSVLSAMCVALHHWLTHVINHVASIQSVEIIPARIVNLLLMFHFAFLVTVLQRHPTTAVAAMLGLDEHVMHSLKMNQVTLMI